MTRTEVRDLLLTSVVTTVLVLVAFGTLRLAFPDPTIQGGSCPSSLGEPAYSECVRSWHVSHADRTVHRIGMGLGVILVATVALLLIERRRLISGVRLPLAFAMAAGFTVPQTAITLGAVEPAGSAYLAAAGLFATASVLPAKRPRLRQLVAAGGLAVMAFFATFAAYFVFFYAAP